MTHKNARSEGQRPRRSGLRLGTDPGMPIVVGPGQIQSRLRSLATSKKDRVMRGAPRKIKVRVMEALESDQE